MSPALDHDAPTGRTTAFVFSIIGLLAVLMALPLVLLLGGPIEGWLLGAGLWIVNWIGQLYTGKMSIGLKPTAAVGMTGVSFITRAWIVAIILFVFALQVSETIGLTAAGVFLAAFTFDLLGRSVLHAMSQRDDEELTE
ncbi:MAG: hypothetical protein ACR2N6_03685 [Miltoncostaeaceae bacterium]